MNKIAEEALDLLEQLMDENGKVENCFTFMQRWALESVALTSVDARLGSLTHPLDLNLEGPAILEDMKMIVACMQKFAYRFPYFRYIRTPTWQRFEKAMDDFTVRIFRHIEAAAERMTSEDSAHEPTILEHMLREKKLSFGEILAFISELQPRGSGHDGDSSNISFCFTSRRIHGLSRKHEKKL
ncbi:hypothetical protein MRX96_058667 [Rhipicephalus microplus]